MSGRRERRRRTGDSTTVISATSGYGANTRLPFVDLRLGTQPAVQISPDEARDVARSLIEAAEAAEQDAFLMEWGRTTLGDEQYGIALLVAFRKWREARHEGETGPGDRS